MEIALLRLDMPSDPAAALLLLATEQQVHAFDLTRVSRVSIGRHESNDLQLASRTVSNFHAEILRENKGLVLRDLGSTNGTFVGKERIDNKVVASGDRIRIGNHVLAVQVKPIDDSTDGFIRYRRSPESFGPGTKGTIITLRARSAEATKTLRTNDPHELVLPDLLRLLSAQPGSSVVVFDRHGEGSSVFVHKNRIIDARYGSASGEKALYRMFGWQGASYSIESLENPAAVQRTINLPTDTLIVEGMAHALELGKLVAQLPPLEVPLVLKEDCPLPLTAHSPAEIEIFQAIIRYETIGNVVERSRLADVRVLKLIDSLLRKGVFSVVKSETTMEETFVSRPAQDLI